MNEVARAVRGCVQSHISTSSTGGGMMDNQPAGQLRPKSADLGTENILFPERGIGPGRRLASPVTRFT